MSDEVLEYVNALDTTVDLTCLGAPLNGVMGRYSPPIVVREAAVPDRPGGVLLSVRHDIVEVDVPYTVKGADRSAVRANVRTLMTNLNPMLGSGYLRAVDWNGLERRLNCRCVGGMEGDETIGVRSPVSQNFVLVFRAYDPYWYSITPITGSWAIPVTGVAFFPYFPLRLSEDTIYESAAVLVNAGDVAVWPVWTITGPFTGVRLTLGSAVLELTYPADAGEVITLDTRPGAKTAVSDLFGNVFNWLTETQMFALDPGSNSVEIGLVGGGSGSSVSVSYVENWLSV